MIKRISVVVMIVALSIFVFSGMGLAKAKQEIPIGIIGVFTGMDTDVNGMSYGTRDYFEWYNDKFGGIKGYPIKCIMLDGKNSIPDEVKNFKRLVSVEKAVLINGWGTGGTKALKDQVNKVVKIPYLSESLAIEVIDPVNCPYNFVLGPSYEGQIEIGMVWAKMQGAKTYAILHNDIEYGRGTTKNVIKAGLADKLGLEVLGTVEYPWHLTDCTAQLLRIKKMNPDYVYIQDSATNCTTILRDAAKVGFPASKLIADCWNFNPIIPETLGKDAEGFKPIMLFPDYGSDIPLMKEILEYAATHKIEKKDQNYVRGWTEGKLIVESIKRVIEKSNGKLPKTAQFRKMIRDEMEALENFDVGGSVPPVTYADHQGTSSAMIGEVRDGKFVSISDWIDIRKVREELNKK